MASKLLRLGGRLAALASAFAALAVSAPAVQAQGDYPSKPVRVVVPYAPGGAVDLVTRRIAQQLTEQTGTSFFVDNKPGGTGTIGITQVARSTPDGTTLLTNDMTYAILPHVFHKLAWDYDKDLVPVAAFNFAPAAIVVAADSKFKTLGELIAYGKAHPGKLNYGTGGAGTMPHFSTEALKMAGQFDAVHVPFKGNGEATMALLTHTIDFQIASTAGVMGQLQGGKVRLLAVSGKERLKAIPTVPTFAEAGLPNYRVVNFTGLWAPKGTPANVVQRLEREIGAAMRGNSMREYADSIGALPNVVVGADFAQLLRSQTQYWSAVAASAKVEKQ